MSTTTPNLPTTTTEDSPPKPIPNFWTHHIPLEILIFTTTYLLIVPFTLVLIAGIRGIYQHLAGIELNATGFDQALASAGQWTLWPTWGTPVIGCFLGRLGIEVMRQRRARWEWEGRKDDEEGGRM